MKPHLLLFVLVPTQFICCLAAQADSSRQKLSIESRAERLIIRFGEMEIAHYVFHDRAIPRPYFAHVKTPGGTQATRSHPPVEGKDATDHATMHPGISTSFGFGRFKGGIPHISDTT